jgi:hypothetical protein
MAIKTCENRKLKEEILVLQLKILKRVKGSLGSKARGAP